MLLVDLVFKKDKVKSILKMFLVEFSLYGCSILLLFVFLERDKVNMVRTQTEFTG